MKTKTIAPVRAAAPAKGKPAETAVPLVVFGASGMLAGEFLRLCEQHPALRPVFLASREPSALARSQPHLPDRIPAGTADEAMDELSSRLENGGRAAAVLALPHGESAALWQRLRARLGARADRLFLVDLAADYRLADPQLYESAYGESHPDPRELASFAYGLPELGRERLAKARRVAAPGCFATAMQLAVVPAARDRSIDPERPWILLGITGSSGSGAAPKPGTHHPYRDGNLWVYASDGHRHEAELAQALAREGVRARIQFSAASGPFVRGIHLSAWLPLARPLDARAARAIYAEAYANEPFVEVLEEGAPDLRRVVGSNRASLGVYVRDGVLGVLLTLDNLVKGGAGQALQCLNRMLGFPETWGLPRAGLGVA